MPSFSSEERQLLDDSLQNYLKGHYTFDLWKKLARGPGTEGFGRTEWAKYAELGWLGTAVPEDGGGAGGGMTELAIVMAGAGRHLSDCLIDRGVSHFDRHGSLHRGFNGASPGLQHRGIAGDGMAQNYAGSSRIMQGFAICSKPFWDREG